jgi:UV DNA damage endonuclease
MKIGYPCINRSLDCRVNRGFRLASYSQERMADCVSGNLDCLMEMLEYNRGYHMLFLRISSDLIPFASHPVCDYDWPDIHKLRFREIAAFIKKNNIRISMHPDQFTLINSIREEVFDRSVKELEYHARVLDLLELDHTAKIQIHVGGVYNDRKVSLKRFVTRFEMLEPTIQNRLVVENDERLFTLKDCLEIHRETGIPVLFDVFHHRLFNHGEGVRRSLELSQQTWAEKDGILMVDYSSNQPEARTGTHAHTIDPLDFQSFILKSKPVDFDLMLEIKDKEKSVLKAMESLQDDSRFISV